MNRSKIIELLNIRDMDEDELRAKSNCSLDEIKKFLNILVFEGRIIRLGDGKYSLTGSRIVLSYVKNRFKDYAYVTPLKKDMRDIRLVGQDATKLLKGDCVFVRIDDDLYENNGEGSLIQIVRPVSFIEGIISKDDEGFFISSFKNIDSEVRFDVKRTSIELIEGQLVRAEIIDRRDYICDVEVTKVISKPGDRMFDLMNAIVEKGGTLTYPKDVDEQAINLATNFTDTAKNRHDLTNEFMVTIDGASTKDFDDGLSIRKTDYGYDVGVHIADVASYVKEGTPLDYEARLRATSMYFPETEISMLPTILSDDVCSLNPNAEKLTITCLLHLNHDGIYKSSEVFLSKVKSKARLTYDQVDEYIKGKKDEFDGDLKYNVDLLLECSKKILKRKKEKGQLVFGRNYPEFTLDKDGNPDTVKPRHESEAENLVEVFMILANDEVGKLLNDKAVPALFRTEDAPRFDDMCLIRDFLDRFGIDPDLFPKIITSENLAKYFESIPKWAEVIGKLCTLKMMNPVVYSRSPGLHFGLNCNHYVYFTSPIRRYPDLLTHRLLHDFLLDNNDEADRKAVGDYLDNLPDLLSQEEKLAKQIMNNAHDMECERFMSSRMYDVMEGEVRNFIGSGIKVSLTNGITGLLPYDHIDNDYYKNQRMCFSVYGRNTEREIVLGDVLKVAVVDIIPDTHTLILGTEEYLDESGDDIDENTLQNMKKNGVYIG